MHLLATTPEVVPRGPLFVNANITLPPNPFPRERGFVASLHFETQRQAEPFASISDQDPPSKPAAGEESIGLADTLTRRISSPASLSSEKKYNMHSDSNHTIARDK